MRIARRKPARRGVPARASALVVSLGMVSLLAFLPAAPHASAGREATPRSATLGPLLNGSTICNSNTDAPSSLDIPLAAPTLGLHAGGTINVTYQVAIVGNASSVPDAEVHVPSVFGFFPNAAGGLLQVYNLPSSGWIPGANWTSAWTTTSSLRVANNVTFTPNGSAFLSTEKIAVQANRAYGNVTLEVRWSWVVRAPNGTTERSPWSVPAETATSPYLPSVFYPAPYVGSAGSSGPSVPIGSTYVDDLVGFISNTTFHVKIEYPNGTNVQAIWERTPPGNSTPFPAQAPVLGSDGRLDAGNYIFHVHDRCGAIVQIQFFHASYLPMAFVHISVLPSWCGPVTINGSAYGNGSTARIEPGPSLVPVTVPACRGASFVGWNVSGALALSSESARQTGIYVSANGSLSAQFNDGGLVPWASANVSGGPVPLSVGFHGSATGGFPPYGFNWSFGDGATTTAQNPDHVYSARGGYDADLWVSDSAGDEAEAMVPVFVGLSPLSVQVQANVSEGPAPLTVAFSSEVAGGDAPYTYTWNFGNGQSAATSAPVHTFGSAGNYSVRLDVVDGAAPPSAGSGQLAVDAYGPLQVQIESDPSHGAVPVDATFHANVSGGVPPYSVRWHLDDDAADFAEGPTGEVTFTDPGTSSVTASVTDRIGGRANATVPVELAPPLSTSIVAPAGDVRSGSTVDLRAVTEGGSSATAFVWRVGGQVFETGNGTLRLTAGPAGDYPVQVNVTDAWNDTASAASILHVQGPGGATEGPWANLGKALAGPFGIVGVAGPALLLAVVLVHRSRRGRRPRPAGPPPAGPSGADPPKGGGEGPFPTVDRGVPPRGPPEGT